MSSENFNQEAPGILIHVHPLILPKVVRKCITIHQLLICKCISKDLCQALNSASAKGAVYIKPADLITGRKYRIKEIGVLDTRYGKSLRVTIAYDQGIAHLFLPKRILQAIDEQLINSYKGNLNLIYLGEKGGSQLYKFVTVADKETQSGLEEEEEEEEE
uniref:Uncharacterized protein n=1 Tax=Rhodnius prolixus TaxID=13249 RepID=T1I4K3_RHOPR